jgi:hypothetical protein
LARLAIRAGSRRPLIAGQKLPACKFEFAAYKLKFPAYKLPVSRREVLQGHWGVKSGCFAPFQACSTHDIVHGLANAEEAAEPVPQPLLPSKEYI